MKTVLLTLAFAAACSAFAQAPTAPATGAAGGKRMHPRDLPACQAPFAACEKAGYKVGAHKKGDKEGADMGLWVDCIDAAADNKKQIPGVDQASAQACRTAMKGMKGK